jgi:hypothetical protein
MPADIFRSMEDASAVDLDWFWRGWFYTTDYVDQSIDYVKWYQVRNDKGNPENKSVKSKKGDLKASSGENKFEDFSNGPQPFTILPTDDRFYGEFQNRIDDKAVIDKLVGKNIYEVKLSNKGGLVMPVVIQWTYKDGSKEIERIPAEIWRTNETEIKKVFVKTKEVVKVVIDPNEELSDISQENNVFPKVPEPSKFDQFKKKN